MPERTAPYLPLLPHPQSAAAATARRIGASAELAAEGALRLRYVLAADARQVRIPAPAPAGGRADGLWAHTCFEAFVRTAESPEYVELNFSPSGEWAAYRFESYRQGMTPAALAEPPGLSMRRRDGQLELEAEVRLDAELAPWMLAAAAGRPLRIALSAVVEDQEGRLSYWALRHPPGRPDFHHPDAFALALKLPGTRPNT
jgi:hypothetical protein